MEIAVCIGSSCHLKGARKVVEGLQKIIAERGLTDKIRLCGKFCMGNCQNGVCVTINEEMFSVKPAEVQYFFEREVAPKL
ncbi:MAG: (2Fe-2S) ferredoxin domain-containing protein [Candidatus Bruticola sp.]